MLLRDFLSILPYDASGIKRTSCPELLSRAWFAVRHEKTVFDGCDRCSVCLLLTSDLAGRSPLILTEAADRNLVGNWKNVSHKDLILKCSDRWITAVLVGGFNGIPHLSIRRLTHPNLRTVGVLAVNHEKLVVINGKRSRQSVLASNPLNTIPLQPIM